MTDTDNTQATEALIKIVKALEPLGDVDKTRVLEAVARLLDLDAVL